MTAKAKIAKAKQTSALSLDDLDKQYNPSVIVPAKIKQALTKLGDHAMTNVNFQRETGVTMTQLAQFSDLFESFQVVVREGGRPKTLWCGTEAFARKVRERLGV